MLTDTTIETTRKWINLSLAQRGVWLDAKLNQASDYLLGGWARTKSPLDIATVRQSISLLMARHDALRLRVDDQLPRQWLDESVDPPLTISDLPDTGDAQTAFEHFLEERLRVTLPLGDHPLFAVDLLRAGNHTTYVLWRFHHLISDSASVVITLNHFANAYETLTALTPQELTPPSSYLKIISSDAAYLESAAYQKDLTYWTKRFEPLPPPLIADLELRVTNTTKAPSAFWRLEGSAFVNFKDAAKAAGTNSQRALFGLFSAVLGRRWGHTDVVSGIALHRRDLSNIHTIGMLAGVTPVRIQFDSFWTIEECVQAFSEQMDRDLRQQRLPLDVLGRALRLPGTGRSALFQATLSFMPAEKTRGDAGSLGSDLVLDQVHTKEATPIRFDAVEFPGGDGFTLSVTVNPAFLPEAECHSLLNLLKDCIGRFTEQPDTRFEELPTVTSDEFDTVVNRWSGTSATFEKGTVEDLFASQVKANPKALALIAADGREITYAELDERSTTLARYLVSQGIGPERVVGVRMERSAETVIAFLAILKAGGVYLPLDPAYPTHRLEYMIENAGAALVLESIETLNADVELPPQPNTERLAYIIYTSGTTGLPKGVAVPQRSAVNLLHARSASYDPVEPGDRVLAVTSVSFDMSIEQMLFPLLRGATVVIAGDVRTLGAHGFWQLLVDRKITHIDFVPSFVESVLDSAPPAKDLSLKRLMFGGEALTGSLLTRLRRVLPDVEVVNVYGPTETCIDATYHRVGAEDLSRAVVPIGRPLPNYRAYILDEGLDPVGAGIVGELHIGGVSLARGYIQAPDLTAQRFIANPFAQSPGERLYCTGDLARWLPDGSIAFMGRKDQQVKVRGFRVELGEIEAELRKLPGVRDAAVIAQTQNGDARFIGYFTAQGTPPDIDSLRSGLAAVLPDYMVPAAFVHLDKLPLSANGKLDRKALPNPGQSAFVARAFEAPIGEIETSMAAIWAELLKVDRVGRHDNFFELGGHSLLAVSLMERLERQGISGDIRVLFSAPTIAGLAASISQAPVTVAAPPNGILPGADKITPDMLPLVKLSQQQIDRIVAAVPGGAQNLQDIYPLAPLQEGMFFQHLMSAKGDPYLPLVLLAFDSRDRLDNFRSALARVVERHDSLRTGFISEGLDEPLQFVLRQVSVPTEELSFDPSADVSAELLARLDRATYRMDLSQAPLIRVVFAQDATNNRWLLALMTHHLICDNTGQDIIVHELRSLMADAQVALPEPSPYRNFIAQTRLGVDRAEQEKFFTGLLADVDEPTAPFGLLDPQAAGERIEEGILPLDADLSRRIRESAKQLGVTPASLFHLAWAAVLGHVSGRNDVVFGSVLFGRMRAGAGADRAVGMFINTLPLRIRLDEPGLAPAILQTHRLLADLLAHEHAPLALAQRASQVSAPTPLFSSLFNYRYYPEGAGQFEWPGVRIVHNSERTNYPLSMAVDDSGPGFVLRSLAHPTAGGERVCRYLQQAVKSLLDLLEREPDTAPSRLQIVPRAERHLLLEDWNRTDAKFTHGTLDGLFNEQARRTPDAVAVIARDGRQITYAQLDSLSTRLARQLAANGVQPETVVGVRMERSAETVVALMGILKAGGVYLPLDPAYPPDRLEYIAKDAGAHLILTSLDQLEGDADHPTFTDPNRLAYIIYTSGTSGLPKGVAVSHVPPVNLAFARRACHDPIGVGDRILAAISVGFDVSIGQLLLPLLSGATVVIAGDLKAMGPAEFWSFIAERGVTHINSVPSFFDSILDAAPAAGSLSLKRLMLGGEALSGALVSRIQRAIPGIQVVNMYGPTEACIDATYHIATQEDFSAAVLPIGRPLSNYRAYVLDSRLEPVGTGVSGELYLGGVGLARGYVNSPELTAERFVPDPFSGASGAKLYRSGDLARWRADGVLEFLGRADEQVKIRGFRVEPGEIAAQLLQLNGVREAAVVPQNAPGGTRLIAYFSAADAVTVDSLRAALAAKLPDYMVPAAFVKVDSLPLTPNGKLDRKALPHPEATAFAARVYEAPVGETETKIAALWCDLLKLPQVSRHDNFFELGGHSLLAMTLVERLQQQGLATDVRALFTNPTVAGLAEACSSATPQYDAPPNLIALGTQRITPEMLTLVQLTQPEIDTIAASIPGGHGNIQDIYPLAPLQEGILFQHLVSQTGDPYLIPFLLALDTRERLDQFLSALRRMAARHDVLRTAIISQGVDSPVQVVLRQVDLPVEEVALNPGHSGKDAAAELLGHFNPQTYKIDLSRAPFLRAAFAHDPANDRWLLLMVTHHLVVDNTSMALMVAELHALMNGAEAALPAPVPYRNFIAQTLQGTSTEEHRKFFEQMLADVDEPTAPFGLLDTQVNPADIGDKTVRLTPQLAQQIREQSRQLGISPAALFHLAWASVVGFTSGKSDVVFGTILLGRMRSGAGADRAMGMFINTLPIRFALDETTLRQAALDAQAHLADLLVHEHAPLVIAQRASAIPPPAPLFSSVFNFRNSPEAADSIHWPGVSMLYSFQGTNYPVSMAVDDIGSGFTFQLMAHRIAGVDRLSAYFLSALSDLVSLIEKQPDTPVKSLQILPESERNQVVRQWNQTDAAFPQGTIDELFAAQAARTPHEVAVIAQNGSAISYAELDSQSTRLARQLVANGVAVGDVVGVRMERSAETIVCLLAILKAGGVYLPLDPAYPQQRLDYIAKDSGAKLILTSADQLTGDADLPHLTDPTRLAYIIYTSGTTGLPKGVAVSHVPPVNMAFARRACHDPIGVGDRILAAISVGFDVSIGQLLLPLLSSATIVIAGDLKTMGPAEFWSFIAERGVTHINSVPSFFDSILDATPTAGTLALKRLMLGGEALSGSLVGRIQRAIPGIQVVNMYGPTEACIDATYHIATNDDLSAAVLPIGRPLSNYRAYVLDGRLAPVGVGIPGELYLGGLGLAEGYVNSPELTAQRFIPDPFSTVPGARLYRTGDRAQWRADGVIEFLGRIDKQVKVRGHRIELGEIEAALLEQPAIARAAVIADQSAGTTRLLAYLVPPSGVSAPDTLQLRSDLGSRLPDYMVPAAFFVLPELPLTPNGKLDIKALPKPSAAQISTVEFVAPRNKLETDLQQLWEQILNVRPIGIHDNFFSLGGHSLALMRLVNSCNTQFKSNLSLRVVLESPTIAELAAAIESNSSASQLHPCLIVLRPGNPASTPLFCACTPGGNALGYSNLAAALQSDRTVYGLQNPALFNDEPLVTSLEELAAEFITAMRSVQPHGPYQILGRSVGGLLSLEVGQQLRALGEEASLVGLIDTLYPSGFFPPLTDEQRIQGFGQAFGLASLFEDPQTAPRTVAELHERGRALRLEYQGIDTAQFERIFAIYWGMVELSCIYQPKPYDGPFAFFRSLQRLGDAVDQPHEWSHIAPSAVVLDFDCSHEDFRTEWMAPKIAEKLEPLLQPAAGAVQTVRANPLIALHPSGTKQNLFCIHPAGGRAFCYLPLTREFGNAQPVYGLQASGLHKNEPLPESIQQMAADYIAAIRQTQPNGPYQLLGMSSGGVIALEMAHQLQAAGETVSLLGLLDPSLPESIESLSHEEALEAMHYELNCADLLGEAHASLAELVAAAIKAGRLPANFTTNEAERISRVLQAVVRSHAAYQPQPWSGPTVLLRATKLKKPDDELADWSPYFTDLRVNDINASHYDLVTTALAPTVAALLRPYLK